MKFEISRTSRYDKTPHLNAFIEEYTLIDKRTIESIEEAKELMKEEKTWLKEWFEVGENHRDIIDGEDKMIARDLPNRRRWVIEIEDLFKWIEELGCKIILEPKSYNNATNPLHQIEIYDDYRE